MLSLHCVNASARYAASTLRAGQVLREVEHFARSVWAAPAAGYCMYDITQLRYSDFALDLLLFAARLRLFTG
jgi:hypothetical protein